MEIRQADLSFPWNGVLEGEQVSYYQKWFKDIKSIYMNCEGMSEDTLMYTVFSKEEEAIEGHLNWGLTVLEPVTVNGECNMTRGHFHQDLNCQEYYWCSQGHGLLLLMDEQGECWAEEVKPNSLHHIDGHLAHRLINTGNEQMKVVACWPSTSGHDYRRIENHPFPVRVFKENGKTVVKERT